MNIELNPKEFLGTIKQIKTVLDMLVKDPDGYAVTITAEHSSEEVSFSCARETNYINFKVPAKIKEPGDLTLNSKFVSKLKLSGKKLQITKNEQELRFKCGNLKANFPNLDVTKIIPLDTNEFKWYPVNTLPYREGIKCVSFKSDMDNNLAILIDSTSDQTVLSVQDSLIGSSCIIKQGGVTVYNNKTPKDKRFMNHAGMLLKEVIPQSEVKKVKFKDDRTEEGLTTLLNTPCEKVDPDLLKKYFTIMWNIVHHPEAPNFELIVFLDIFNYITKLDNTIEIGFDQSLWGAKSDKFTFLCAQPGEVNDIDNVNEYIEDIFVFKEFYDKLNNLSNIIMEELKLEDNEDYFRIFYYLLNSSILQDHAVSLLKGNPEVDDLIDMFDIDLEDSEVEEEYKSYEEDPEFIEKIKSVCTKEILLEVLTTSLPYLAFDTKEALNAIEGVTSVIFDNDDNFRIKLTNKKVNDIDVANCLTEEGSCKGEDYFSLLHNADIDVNLSSTYTLNFLRIFKEGVTKLYDFDNLVMEHVNINNGIITRAIMPQTE